MFYVKCSTDAVLTNKFAVLLHNIHCIANSDHTTTALLWCCSTRRKRCHLPAYMSTVTSYAASLVPLPNKSFVRCFINDRKQQLSVDMQLIGIVCLWRFPHPWWRRSKYCGMSPVDIAPYHLKGFPLQINCHATRIQFFLLVAIFLRHTSAVCNLITVCAIISY
jgi:hypothetical protein